MSVFGIFLSLTAPIQKHKQQLSNILQDFGPFLKTIAGTISSIWFVLLYNSLGAFEMLRSRSLHKVNSTGDLCGNSSSGFCNSTGDLCKSITKNRTQKILEQYHITIKPKAYKSNSLSDLTSETSGHKPKLSKRTRKHLRSSTRHLVFDNCGDSLERRWVNRLVNRCSYMSWNLKGKKTKKKNQMSSENFAKKFANEYYNKYQPECSGADNTSVTSTDDISSQKMASFPFKPTPSGNLKVQSNQVVFQSSTVGVLLADPTQAEVQVKFEGKATGDEDDNEGSSDNVHDCIQYDARDEKILTDKRNARRNKQNLDKKGSKDLKTLGYMNCGSIDWMRVQLPKKQDLYQEFFKRLHNFINTDTVIRIGRNEFRCHRIVLQIYSPFFNNKSSKEIELPESIVTCTTFPTIYEWMIFNSPESNKFLKRDNVLNLFCAAQYLEIKDLEDQCWSFIVNESLFNEDTAFDLFQEARAKGMTPVVDIMVPRVMKFFLPLVASNDYLRLEIDEVTTFLKSNNICVTSEIEVLMAGVRWLHGDWASRRQYAIDIMSCIRFGLISPWQLVDIKRNPENAEILEIVCDPDVQQMVDDGLAYVIIKYWYGNTSNNYYHWIDVLGLTEPAERNWIGEEKNHVTYKDFLEYLKQFTAPREQMYQQMAMMQTLRRNDDASGSLRGIDKEKLDMHRQKIDFPLPATLKGLGNNEYPTISDVLKTKMKGKEKCTQNYETRWPHVQGQKYNGVGETENRTENVQVHRVFVEDYCRQKSSNYVDDYDRLRPSQIFERPEKDSSDDLRTTNFTNSDNTDTEREKFLGPSRVRKLSVAASYLAAATASIGGNKREGQESSSRRQSAADSRSDQNVQEKVSQENYTPSPQISMFNESKEKLAKLNMNKLSASILGPSNKTYITETSLFNWERETVLVFGGFDPHTPYAVSSNSGKDIFRFDPVNNVWDNVGELPEPRHHHSVAFLRGRVFLVGGADPRSDDIRGTSVVVSTVWSYEPVTKSWYSECGLAIPRKNFGLVSHRMAMYAIGGQDRKGRVLRSVEKFDPKTSGWSEVRSMNVARMAVAAVKYREYIWVAGGMTGDKKKPVCKVVECYNYKTNDWTIIQSLRFPRCFATLFSMNDKLYIIGGAGKVTERDKTPSSVGAIDAWDWQLRQWVPETEMSIPRHGHALAYLGTQLIIIGGVTTIYMRALNNVESFCCERQAWIRGVAPLPCPLSGHGAVTLPPASLM